MKTEKGNLLIAEFMGFKESIAPNGYPVFKIPEPYMSLEHSTGCYVSDIAFDYSWDWLMPVVEKIEKDKNIHFKIDYKSCLIFQFTDVIISHTESTKIKAIWKSVFDYISYKKRDKTPTYILWWNKLKFFERERLAQLFYTQLGTQLDSYQIENIWKNGKEKENCNYL